MPTLSIVVITYNVSPFVSAALDSLLSQPGPDFEIILADDGSTDGTWEIVERAAALDTRLKPLRLAHVGRPSVVRNTGMQRATGDFVTFLDGDDIYFPSRLERVARVFERYPDLDIVFHDVRRMHEDGRPKAATYLTESNFLQRVQSYWEKQDGDVYLAGPRFAAFTSAIFCGIHTSTVTIRAERLKREPVWFPEDLITGEDLDFWYRLVEGSRIAYLDAILSGYRERESSVTKDRSLFFAGTIEADRRNLVRVSDRLTPTERDYYVRRIGKRYKHLAYEQERAGRPAAARAAYLAGFRITPGLAWLVLYAKTWVPRGWIGAARRLAGSGAGK